jgi:beta-galactosidase
MMCTSRRRFLGAGSAVLAVETASAAPRSAMQAEVSLDGVWQFRPDPKGAPQPPADGWSEVVVPHTWQVSEAWADYLGVAWYRREFDAPAEWSSSLVRVEFETVYHTADVWVNNERMGTHPGRGYTAFAIDITRALRFGTVNNILVRVDNSFRDNILPRANSYDWTPDGGITRPVRLLVTPPCYIESAAVDAVPDLETGGAQIDVGIMLRNAAATPVSLDVECAVIDDATGNRVLSHRLPARVNVKGKSTRMVPVSLLLRQAKLWHFDHPHLYRLEIHAGAHRYETTFGVRQFEVRGTAFYLNGERVWLMGVERMAGSRPDIGMAESEAWIRHDHDDMKELNCVFTRVHWPQDKRVLDYCDRHGILIQTEVPTWGGDTFKNMREEPSAEILENGLQQLREMIARDRNHPCIFAWGVANEVGGQNPVAKKFVRRLYEEARRLDRRRLITYASNSLKRAVEADVAGEMDFIELNEYYETWYGQTADSMRSNLEYIHRAFPNKPVVISEYGLCECHPAHKGGDARRIGILQTHTRIYRDFDFVGGAIFFCYNDYRTHMGDKGRGRLKQRVHGVVDLYGARKPSFEALRNESSPIERFEVVPGGAGLDVFVFTRRRLPAYTLDGYRLRWIVYGFGGLPMEQHEMPLPELAPGAEFRAKLEWAEAGAVRVRVDVIRPTGHSAATVYSSISRISQ